MSERAIVHEGREIGRAWPVPAGWSFRSADGAVTGIAGSFEAACSEIMVVEAARERARKEHEG